MKSRVIKCLALLLALMMTVSLFAGCGGNKGGTSSDEDEIIYVDEFGNPIDPDSLGGSGDGDTDGDGSADGDNATATTSKKQNAGTSGSGKSDKNNTTAANKGKTKFESDPYSDIPSNLKGTTVSVLLWRTGEATDHALAEAFTKQTGIKVNLIEMTSNGGYATKLASLISANEAPDVCVINSDSFPGFAISSLEPLDENVFRLDDSIWDKSVMDTYKINGKYYGLSVAGSWYCCDTSYLTYYNPTALKANGIDTTPYQLWKAGKWNIDSMLEIARKFKAKNASYHGLSIQTNTVINPYMLSQGVDFVKYDGKTFSSNMSDSVVLKANMNLADWYSEGLVEGWDSAGVGAGTVALFDAIAYGIYKEANWFTVSTDSIEVVPVAGSYVVANSKLWGIPKGAKNAQAAAYFLRFFLDPDSFKYTSYGSMGNTICTSQQYEVWQYLTAASTPKAANISRGVLNYYDSSSYGTLTTAINSTTSANIKTVLDSNKSMVEAACKRSNTNLKKVRTTASYVK